MRLTTHILVQHFSQNLRKLQELWSLSIRKHARIRGALTLAPPAIRPERQTPAPVTYPPKSRHTIPAQARSFFQSPT